MNTKYYEVPQLSYLDVQKIADQWSEEYGVSSYDTWNHPYTNQDMTIISVLWSMHTARNMSVEGMRLHFERHMRAVDTRNYMKAQYTPLQLSDDLWA